MTAVPSWDIMGPAETDADLARAATGGDRDAFAAIYDRYSDRLHDFCVGMLRDRDGAADCVQDVFCTAATRLPQLRDPDKLRPWLYAIARSEAMRRLRERRRETLSEELPETVSSDPGPDTLAARTELADLIVEAAGGLSDRDRSVLELAYHQGLDGSDLADALGVSPGNAAKMVYRLRETIKHSLGALLVSRRVRATGGGCPELAAILEGWDGQFSVLMRKRISRHIESCPLCDDERQRLVSPVALLGAIPVFIPAPASLRDRTLSGIDLTTSSTPFDSIPPESGSESPGAGQNPPAPDQKGDDAGGGHTRRLIAVTALLIGTLVAALGLTIGLMQQKNVNIAPADIAETEQPASTPAAPLKSTPSNPIPAPPPAPPKSTTPVPVPTDTATATASAPITTDGAPPPRAADPAQPLPGLPDPPIPPAPEPPASRDRPSSNLPNDAVPPRVRVQPPAGIAGVPPAAADPPTRRANNPPPKPPEPPTRRAVGSIGSPDPPR